MDLSPHEGGGSSESHPVVDTEYDHRKDRSPTKVITDALARAAGIDPMELPSLYDYIDPDALEAILDRPDGTQDPDTILCFRVEKWQVIAYGNGRISIYKITDSNIEGLADA